MFMPTDPLPPLSTTHARLQSPGSLALLGLLLAVLCMLLVTKTALSLPFAGRHFSSDGQHLQLHTGQQTLALQALLPARGPAIPLPAWLGVEEPDLLSAYASYNALFATQTQLIPAWNSGSAILLADDGSRHPVIPRTRQWHDLPWTFWLQLGFGTAALAIGLGIWVFQPRRLPAILQLLTAAGYAMSVWAASIYSSRELLVPGALFHGLSLLNHAGAALFGFAMLALLCCYPRPLGKPRLILPAIFLTWLALCTANTLQWLPDLDSWYALVGLIFLATVAAAIRQWQLSPQDPLSRASLRWLLLSFLLGSGLFVLLQVLPILLEADSLVVPQSVSIGSFLFIYVGLAIGISRHGVFQLERWWLAAWGWLLGGALVLVLDVFLAWSLPLGDWSALTLSIAIAGWIYFPLRQWLLDHWLRQESETDQQLRNATRQLVDLESDARICEQWPALLATVFRPLHTRLGDTPSDTHLAGSGLHLLVPDLQGNRHVRLSCCNQGNRLFMPEDIRRARDLHALATHARQALEARAQGALMERTRIKRDLHDDLGARLLSILHGQSPDQMRDDARQAVRDLRQTLNTLDERSQALHETLTCIEREARDRLRACGLDLEVHHARLPEGMLNARQHANLTRAVRECLTNIIKHASASRVRLTLWQQNGCLHVDIEDNGRYRPPQAGNAGGQGLHIIRSRLEELGGNAAWRENGNGGCTVSLAFPQAMDACQAPGSGACETP